MTNLTKKLKKQREELEGDLAMKSIPTKDYEGVLYGQIPHLNKELKEKFKKSQTQTLKAVLEEVEGGEKKECPVCSRSKGRDGYYIFQRESIKCKNCDGEGEVDNEPVIELKRKLNQLVDDE